MNTKSLIDIVGQEPLFTTGMLLSPGVDPQAVRKQLSRWTRNGTVVQLRRGLYSLGKRYRRADPHPFEVSNALVPASYVSMESVLAEWGLIPEAIFVTTAVTTGRQGTRQTPFGTFVYQHVKRDLFWGYETVELPGGRTAYAARPEKALLDLAYLRTGSDAPGFAFELRLQRLEQLDLERLSDFATRIGSRKVMRFAMNVVNLAHIERVESGLS